jgi:hypothetical protein
MPIKERAGPQGCVLVLKEYAVCIAPCLELQYKPAVLALQCQRHNVKIKLT